MRSTKHLISWVLSLFILIFNSPLALAMNYSDIGSDHWAYKEIKEMSKMKVILGYPDKTFKPENPVSRAEFTTMVIKALNKENMPVVGGLDFTDLPESFWAYGDILRSKELGLIVGYPDNTFQPENQITKSEATSIISKTVKDCEVPCGSGGCPVVETTECVLKQFADKKDISDWAKKSFEKAVNYGLYVNHPDEGYLNPNKDLTRAETAVLLYKIRKNPCIVKEFYQGPELVKAVQESKEPLVSLVEKPQVLKAEKSKTMIEHLPETPYTGEVREVEITGSVLKLLADNVFAVNFEEGFYSKQQKQGGIVHLVFNKSLVTEEGTAVIPAGSKLAAEITRLKKGKPFHLNGEAELAINSLILPSGKTYPISGYVVNKNLLEPEFGMCNIKRFGTIAGSVAAFGTLLGLTVSSGGDIGEGTAAGAIIGGSVGVLAGLVAPGCGVNVPADENIYVQLSEDANIELD